MKILVRADASHQMGVGHVFRCLALAEALRESGSAVTFVCRELPGNLCGFLEARGTVRVWRLPRPNQELISTTADLPHAAWLGVDQQTDAQQVLDLLKAESAAPMADWLIVDHYALDRTWERSLRPAVRHLMAIDDVADRFHEVELLLDQNIWANPAERYRQLVHDDCQLLLGTRFALLRPEFAAARATRAKRDGSVRRVLVCFGGTDATDETAKALAALRRIGRPDLTIAVVVGAQNQQRQEIADQVAELPGASLYVQADQMAELMACADLAIGAGGSTTWERCCMGLPALIIAVARNQEGIVEACNSHGAGIYLGTASAVTVSGLQQAIEDLLGSPVKVQRLAERAAMLVDGRGTDRVIAAMEGRS
ncbi:MAG: UDP-2,4-diacetamido-2,4,6-trideoxy-beta-L-altropyranose hydrolase [Cyanobacteria bacterium NC_groundwater_1444_Ag_S-0.65um_54_12]|nr:UDP-2,4-diacetamido-2,4,6-trideoxy-beta-L-altropyranose hydrolase [Cyanobacteria bacterium NC_groundwater_1444_Ag_S-0.65um_54_12]